MVHRTSNHPVHRFCAQPLPAHPDRPVDSLQLASPARVLAKNHWSWRLSCAHASIEDLASCAAAAAAAAPNFFGKARHHAHELDTQPPPHPSPRSDRRAGGRAARAGGGPHRGDRRSRQQLSRCPQRSREARAWLDTVGPPAPTTALVPGNPRRLCAKARSPAFPRPGATTCAAMPRRSPPAGSHSIAAARTGDADRRHVRRADPLHRLTGTLGHIQLAGARHHQFTALETAPKRFACC